MREIISGYLPVCSSHWIQNKFLPPWGFFPSIFLYIFIIFFGYLDVNNYINNNPPSPISLPFYFILIAPVKLDLKKKKEGESYMSKQPICPTVLTHKHSLLHRNAVYLISPPQCSCSVNPLGISDGEKKKNSKIFIAYILHFLSYMWFSAPLVFYMFSPFFYFWLVRSLDLELK